MCTIKKSVLKTLTAKCFPEKERLQSLLIDVAL